MGPTPCAPPRRPPPDRGAGRPGAVDQFSHKIKSVGDLQDLLARTVATPGHLLDFMEKGHVSFANCKYLVLDKGDRMLDKDFMSEILKMVEELNMPRKSPEGERQTLMFSALFRTRCSSWRRSSLTTTSSSPSASSSHSTRCLSLTSASSWRS